MLLNILSDWPDINRAIGFDEWIANGDWHIGNILFDGANQFYLIDHNLDMRQPLSPDTPINNYLLNIKLFCTPDEIGRQRIKNQLAAIVNDISPDKATLDIF